MTEQLMREKKKEIKEMGSMELDSFRHIVSVAVISVDAKKELRKAMDEQQTELDKQISPEAVQSKIGQDY